MVGSGSIQNKIVVSERLISIAPKYFSIGAERSSVSNYRLAPAIGWFGLNKNVGYSNTFLLLICFATICHLFYSFLSVSIVEFEQVNAVQDVFDYISYTKQVNYEYTETFEVQIQEIFFFDFQINGYLHWKSILCHKVALDV